MGGKKGKGGRGGGTKSIRPLSFAVVAGHCSVQREGGVEEEGGTGKVYLYQKHNKDILGKGEKGKGKGKAEGKGGDVDSSPCCTMMPGKGDVFVNGVKVKEPRVRQAITFIYTVIYTVTRCLRGVHTIYEAVEAVEYKSGTSQVQVWYKYDRSISSHLTLHTSHTVFPMFSGSCGGGPCGDR